MALTEHSNVYAAAHEDGFNKIVRWFARYRPTLVNYGTSWVAQEPFERLCQKPDVIPDIRHRGLPVVSVERPLPIPTTPFGMNWSLQLTDLQIDFHPSSVFGLPPELGGALEPQHFALRLRVCFGLGCPSRRLEEILGDLGGRLVDIIDGAVRDDRDPHDEQRPDDHRPNDERPNDERPSRPEPEKPLIPIPTDGLTCFCLEAFVIGRIVHRERSGRHRVQLELQGLELVDIGPDPLESILECYARTVIRLVLLPRLSFELRGYTLGATDQLGAVTVEPAVGGPNPAPHNPAVEDDQVKIYVNAGVAP